MTTSRGIVSLNLSSMVERLDSLPATELAYAAGLFDGEGCVATYAKNDAVQRFSYAIYIANTDFRVMKWLLDHLGGKVTKRGGIRTRSANHRECYTWYLTNGRAAAFMAAIRPYAIVKAEQIDLALKLRNTCRFDLRGQIIPVEILQRRRELIEQIKMLKWARHEGPAT